MKRKFVTLSTPARSRKAGPDDPHRLPTQPEAPQDDDLVARLNQAYEDYTQFWGSGDLYGEAAAALESLQAQLAAAREREARLREALRDQVIGHEYRNRDGERVHTADYCILCGIGLWRLGEPERHAPGCLAAPDTEGA